MGIPIQPTSVSASFFSDTIAITHHEKCCHIQGINAKRILQETVTINFKFVKITEILVMHTK